MEAKMELDPDDIFGDDDDDLDNEFSMGREATKEFVVYLVDASPKMFSTPVRSDNENGESHFHAAMSCITQSLKTQIINSSYDEVSICFFNTREKKNLQDLNGVFVFNVPERENLDRPTARLIKEFSNVEESFMKIIGSQYGILSGSRENSLYNALWVAQALLRKGSSKTVEKRILLFTNEDDPFGAVRGANKFDMMRTTLQRAKDAQDLGISIELLPLSKHDEEFNPSLFYSDLLGLDAQALVQFIPSMGQKLEDMQSQLRKRMFKKRVVRRMSFAISHGLSIDVNTHALIRPTVPGTITWLDSVTNRPLKIERTFICEDTGALLDGPLKRFQPYKSGNVIFTPAELSEIKRVSSGHLRLLGFKPLSCLKEYHNLRPSTFIFPSDEEMVGSTCTFIALHRSMIRLKRFAVAFYGSATRPQLVALVAQDEIIVAGGQIEPPGMHMIYLPYSEDIRPVEELHSEVEVAAPRANDDQIKKAAYLMRRIDLKEFSVCQFANPALQRHYEILQALALEEDELPDIKDETVPDDEGMARPAVVKALEDFKLSVYGENYIEDTNDSKPSDASKKRKAIVENAATESAKYDWNDLADSGKGNPLVAKVSTMKLSNLEAWKDLFLKGYIPQKKIKVSELVEGEHILSIWSPEEGRNSSSGCSKSRSKAGSSRPHSRSRSNVGCSEFDYDPEEIRMDECATILNDLIDLPFPTYMIALETLKDKFMCINFIKMCWGNRYKWLRHITQNPEQRKMYDQWMRHNHPEVEEKLNNALAAPVEALLDGAGNETWPAIRKLLRRETESAASGFSKALSGFDMDQQSKSKMIASLEDYARGVVEAKAKEEAGRVLIRMKDRFATLLSHDSDSMPRVWTGKEDIRAITKTARSSSLKLLSVMAAVRLDDGTDNIETTLSVALTDSGAGAVNNKTITSADSLASSTWEEVPSSKTLITPVQCKSLWRQFKSETEYSVTQVISAQEANKRNNNWLPPPWAILALVVLGFNEFMTLLSNPLYLGVLFVAFLLVKALWVQLDIAGEFRNGALPGLLSLSTKLLPTVMNLLRKLAEEGVKPTANATQPQHQPQRNPAVAAKTFHD